MKRLIFLMTATAGLAISGPAGAETFTYGEVFGGLTYLNDIELVNDAGDTATLSHDTGFNVGGAAGLGFRVPNGLLRVEGELAYRQNSNDQLDLFGLAIDDVDGDVSALSVMGNAYYEIIDLDTPLSYWIGAGLGYARIGIDLTAAGVDVVDDDDGVFAYQGMAGITYAWNENIGLKLGYTYFATAEPTFTAVGTDLDGEYSTHNIKAAIAYTF